MAALLRAGSDVWALTTEWLTVRDLAHMAAGSSRELHSKLAAIQTNRYHRVLLRFPGWDFILNRPKMMCRGRSIMGSIGARAEVAELVQIERLTLEIPETPPFWPANVLEHLCLPTDLCIAAGSTPPMFGNLLFHSVAMHVHMYLSPNLMPWPTAPTDDTTQWVEQQLASLPIVRLCDLGPVHIWVLFYLVTGSLAIVGLAKEMGPHAIPHDERQPIRRAFLLLILTSFSWDKHIVHIMATWLLLPETLARLDCWDACHFCVEHMGVALYRTDQTAIGEKLLDGILHALLDAHEIFRHALNEMTWIRTTHLSRSANLLIRTAHLQPGCWIASFNPAQVSAVTLLLTLEHASWTDARTICSK
jgi:hypothetical protein